MAAVNLHPLARMTVSSTGTGTITLSNAVSGFLTFDLAGCSTAAAGTLVRYAINDTTKSEIAYGTYTSSSLTLTRGSSTTGMKSTNGNSPIDMSLSAQVFITPSERDFLFVVDSSNTSATCALALTLSAALTYGGVTLSNAVTGTGNMVLSASPTLTGTTTIATLAVTSVGAHTITGAITYGGVALNNAVTGTGNMVLSASPTLTGTLTAAAATFSGDVTVSKVSPAFVVNKAASGQHAYLLGRTAGVDRWLMALGDVTAESTANAGSNFSLFRYSDAGAQIDAPITISRATGLMTLVGDPTAALGAATKQYVDTRAGFSAHKNGTDQTGIASVTQTKLTFTTEIFDTGGFYDAANSRWTPSAGKVIVSASAFLFSTLTTGGVCEISIYKNGARYKSADIGAAGGFDGLNVTVIDDANGTDFYEAYIYGTTAGTFDVEGDAHATHFMGVRV